MRDEIEGGIAEFGGIVGRNGRRHANRDALRAIGQQVREGGGENDGLLFRAVIGFAEIDRVFVEPVEDEACDFRETGLGVPHGGGVIAVNIAEIALPVDQGIALGKILSEPDECVIDGLVAVRMVFTDDVADHAGAFFEGLAGIELQKTHRKQKAAMNRLQAVARIGQGTVHNGREGIGEIALFERRLEFNHFDPVTGGHNRLAHAYYPSTKPAQSLGATADSEQ